MTTPYTDADAVERTAGALAGLVLGLLAAAACVAAGWWLHAAVSAPPPRTAAPRPRTCEAWYQMADGAVRSLRWSAPDTCLALSPAERHTPGLMRLVRIFEVPHATR